MNIYAIIVTYNALNWIDKCLSSIQNSSVKVSTVIVDNASSDSTVQYIYSSGYDCILLKQKENLGFGQANNIGIHYALMHGCDYILLLNQDAFILNNTIECLLKNSNQESVFSPIQLNGNGTKLDIMFKNAIMSSNNSFVDDLIVNSLQNTYDVNQTPAACWFIPRQIIEKIGGFNPLFFHYGEDNNYFHRLKFHNIHLFLVPSAFINHDRLLHGNINVYKKNLLFRLLLLNCTNINNSFYEIISNSVKLLLKSYLYGIKGKWYLPGMYLFSIIKIIYLFPRIYRSRIKEKRISTNWL